MEMEDDESSRGGGGGGGGEGCCVEDPNPMTTILLPAGTIRRHRIETGYDSADEFLDDGMAMVDDFMDLQELSQLSDGDLCLSRHLAVAIGLEERQQQQHLKEVEEVEKEKLQENLIAEEDETPPSNHYYGRQEAEMKHKHSGTDIAEEEEDVGLEDIGGIGTGKRQKQQIRRMKNKVANDNGHHNFLLPQSAEMMMDNYHGAGMDMQMELSPTMGHGNSDDGNKMQSAGLFSLLDSTISPHGSTSSTTIEQCQQNQSDVPSLPAPPPIVISPADVDQISITLEKNQQCACADCGKLFNSVWYLKQHAVKHSNDRPFKCRFCMKTYKFRSNLYQHKCPERNRLLLAGEFNLVGHPYRRRAYNRSADKKHKKEQQQQQLLMEQMRQANGDNFDEAAGAISINTGMPNGHLTFNGLGSGSNGQVLSMTPNSFGNHADPHGMGLLMMGCHGDEDAIAGSGGGIGINAFSSSEFNTISGPSAFPAGTIGSTSSFQMESHQQARNYGQFQFQQQQSSMANEFTSSSAVLNRERVLTPELIEEYLRRNKHRLFNCRKCKLYFPSREYFSRHMAYHTELETYKFLCEKCSERFQNDQGFQSHQLQHADQSPHRCAMCNGIFRSALALRRHRENWLQCHSPPPIGMHFPLLVNPIDQFSFVGSDLEEFVGDGEEEENEEEDEEEDKNDARKKTKCHEANPIYGNGVGVHFEAPTQPKMLTRKTTRDSGYQGSDTQSPAGSHSPTGSSSSSSHYSSEQCAIPVNSKNGTDLKRNSSKLEHQLKFGGSQSAGGKSQRNGKLSNNSNTKAKKKSSNNANESGGTMKKRLAPLYGADQCYVPSMMNAAAASSAASRSGAAQMTTDQNNNSRRSYHAV